MASASGGSASRAPQIAPASASFSAELTPIAGVRLRSAASSTTGPPPPPHRCGICSPGPWPACICCIPTSHGIPPARSAQGTYPPCSAVLFAAPHLAHRRASLELALAAAVPHHRGGPRGRPAMPPPCSDAACAMPPTTRGGRSTHLPSVSRVQPGVSGLPQPALVVAGVFCFVIARPPV